MKAKCITKKVSFCYNNVVKTIKRHKMIKNIKLFLKDVAKIFEIPSEIPPLYLSERILAVLGIFLYITL